jgi:hypothetical protein
MHVVTVDRARIDRHLLGPRYLPQQFPASQPDIPSQYLVPMLRHPYQMDISNPIPSGSLVYNLASRKIIILRLKARGLRIPYRGL